ncbi:Vps62-related protein [Parachitinimonas caeni]|uniref:Vps62-related protein n=1 Tax=Parachitinimonas caeni TaxID=3031301 RepID=A0ABT7DYB8_9NEIS|nr:Vps62-related protein [Parachitinimonas caeni]MDK2125059.1 Vps62-related protein [Parachitinimonas caeni]
MKFKQLPVFAALVAALPAAAVTVNPGMNDTELANALAPIMRFASEETNFPVSIETFYQNSILKDKNGNVLKAYPKTVAEITTITGTDLRRKDDFYLDNNATTYGTTYDANAPIYANVVSYTKDGHAYREVHYSMLFGYNGCEMFRAHTKRYTWDSMTKTNFEWCNFGRHPGDWEHMSVRIDAQSGEVTDIFLNAHGKQGQLSPNEIDWSYNRPRVYVARNSHGTHSEDRFYSSSTIINDDWSWTSRGIVTPAGLYELYVGDVTDNHGKTWDTFGRVRVLATTDGSTPTHPITQFPGRWGRINVDNTKVQDPEGNIYYVEDADLANLATTLFKYTNLLDDYRLGTGPIGPWQNPWWKGEDR